MGYCSKCEVNCCHPDTPCRKVLEGKKTPISKVFDRIFKPNSPVQDSYDRSEYEKAVGIFGTATSLDAVLDLRLPLKGSTVP